MEKIEKDEDILEMSNERLLMGYTAVLSLKKLHEGKGGLEQYRDYYKKRAAMLRFEILRRMKEGS